MMRLVLAAAAVVLLGTGEARAAIKTETVEYKHGEQVCEGFLAWDDAQPGKRPGVLVVHEWKGLDVHARAKAVELAGLGYVAFCADMYGKGVRAKDHEEAAKLSGVYRQDRSLMRARAGAALDVLRKHDRVDAGRLAAIGYCFGGTTVLELARAGADVLAVVSFHGGLDTPKPAEGPIKAKVLVCHGAEDKFIPQEAIAALKDEMRRVKADWVFMELGGAVHSFTVRAAGDDPSKGMAYDERADRRSWAAMKTLLAETFGG